MRRRKRRYPRTALATQGMLWAIALSLLVVGVLVMIEAMR